MRYTVGSTEVSEGFRPILDDENSAPPKAGGRAPRGVAHALDEHGKPLCLSPGSFHLFPDEGFPVDGDGVTNCSACLAAA